MSYARATTVDSAPSGDSVKQAVLDLDADLTSIYTDLNTHEALTTGAHGVTGTILGTEDVDDTPVNGADTVPVSSNWAYDHAALTTAHGITGTNTGDETQATIKTKLGAATASVDGYATSTQITKLDGITAGANVTDTSTTTLTNKRVTPRITTITSSGTPTINTDNCDCVTITALAEAITSMTTNLSGTPTNFQKLIIRIKDDGTARAITWGASFVAKGVSLPTTTVLSKLLTVGFIYDTVLNTWGCVAATCEV
jgi:hypothetical protein